MCTACARAPNVRLIFPAVVMDEILKFTKNPYYNLRISETLKKKFKTTYYGTESTTIVITF